MKRVLAIVVVAVAGCTGVQSVSNDQKLTDRQLQQYQQAQPVPFFDWSMDRAALIEIYKAKNEQRETWAVVTSQGTGAPIFSCPAISYPIPADTQLTNPEQIAIVNPPGSSAWYDGVVGQMEPNGVYSSANTDATYVLCIRDNGKVTPVYTEQKVTLFPFPVKIENGVIVDAGGSSSIEVDLGHPGTVPVVTPAP